MKKYLKILSGALGAFVLSAYAAGAAIPTATSTLENIMETVINTTVDLVTVIFSTYWPYVLIFGVLSGLVALFLRFANIGIKK